MTTAVLLAIGFEHDFIARKFASNDWAVDRFYDAVFSWCSIQAAFLFSVYAFFLSRSEPFIKAIAETESFRALRDYVLRALALTLGLTMVALPLFVISPKMELTNKLTVGFGTFWVVSVALTYTFMCFVKVIRVFRKLEGMQDRR